MRAALFRTSVLVLLAAACSPPGAKHKAAGNVLFKKGDVDGALAEYQAAVSADRNDANAHTLVGNALFEKERYTEARAAWEQALALDGRARAAMQGLVMIALREHKEDEAKARLEQMLANQPRDAEALTALGKLLYAKGDLDGAEGHLRQALVFAQNDPSALYTLGLVLAKQKHEEQATAIFDRLEKVTPDKAYAPYGRAVTCALAGKTDRALAELAIAFGRGIDDPEQVERDDSLATLRTSPKFAELVAAARARPKRR